MLTIHLNYASDPHTPLETMWKDTTRKAKSFSLISLKQSLLNMYNHNFSVFLLCWLFFCPSTNLLDDRRSIEISLDFKYLQTFEAFALVFLGSWLSLEGAHAKEEFKITGRNSSVRKSRWVK